MGRPPVRFGRMGTAFDGLGFLGLAQTNSAKPRSKIEPILLPITSEQKFQCKLDFASTIGGSDGEHT